MKKHRTSKKAKILFKQKIPVFVVGVFRMLRFLFFETSKIGNLMTVKHLCCWHILARTFLIRVFCKDWGDEDWSHKGDTVSQFFHNISTKKHPMWRQVCSRIRTLGPKACNFPSLQHGTNQVTLYHSHGHRVQNTPRRVQQRLFAAPAMPKKSGDPVILDPRDAMEVAIWMDRSDGEVKIGSTLPFQGTITLIVSTFESMMIFLFPRIC